MESVDTHKAPSTNTRSSEAHHSAYIVSQAAFFELSTPALAVFAAAATRLARTGTAALSGCSRVPTTSVPWYFRTANFLDVTIKNVQSHWR